MELNTTMHHYLPSMLGHSRPVIDGVKNRHQCVVASSCEQAICVKVHLFST